MEKIKNIGKAKSIALNGIKGNLVDIEAHNSSGIPSFTLVGLPDTSLNESKERIRSVFVSNKLDWSKGKMTVNLCPSNLQKKGNNFDLAIFVATYKALNQEFDLYKDYIWFGELGLDGRLHPIKGILPLVINAKKLGFDHIVVPKGNENEAKLVEDIEIYSFGHIYEIVHFLGGISKEVKYELVENRISILKAESEHKDFNEIIGQSHAKWALEVAAAGGHHALMIGPPGVGKSMLASRLSTILPKLSKQDSLEVTSIHSIAGTLYDQELISIPPFESPHHTATAPSIIGGGSNVKPGAISRAHKGILFLDEAPEFSPRVLQTLRGPLESKIVQIDRANSSVIYPSDFQLIMAANPCPCGYNIGNGIKCKCSSIEKRRYFNRLSGPLLDRIDIQIEVENVKVGINREIGETSENVLKRVIKARESQAYRLIDTPWKLNSEVPGSYYRAKLGNNNDVIKILNDLVNKEILSLRGADRVMRLAWTLYDLDEKNMNNEILDEKYLQIALTLRSIENI